VLVEIAKPKDNAGALRCVRDDGSVIGRNRLVVQLRKSELFAERRAVEPGGVLNLKFPS
jgi:hypothetical protein